MFELTNEQRPCFGLRPVEPGWTRLTLKPTPYDEHVTVGYLDGTVLRKYIETGDNRYTEYELNEQLSEDLKYLMPKTPKGKPVLLSAATLEKRNPVGMSLSGRFQQGEAAFIDLYSNTSQRGYYCSEYDRLELSGIEAFARWVDAWCSETTREDLLELARFAAAPRTHVRFREGDVFRFKINRRLYGYGRILVDYALMRKNKEPFWDCLAGKPVACGVYHIVTERKDVSVEELAGLKSLPSCHMMDNHLFYGAYEIIGNIPIGASEDYPIMYGRSNDLRRDDLLLQCGKLYRKLENCEPLYGEFKNGGIGFGLRFTLPILLECIKTGSNAPYWAQKTAWYNTDLRNPKYHRQLEEVCRQFGLQPTQLIKDFS